MVVITIYGHRVLEVGTDLGECEIDLAASGFDLIDGPHEPVPPRPLITVVDPSVGVRDLETLRGPAPPSVVAVPQEELTELVVPAGHGHVEVVEVIDGEEATSAAVEVWCKNNVPIGIRQASRGVLPWLDSEGACPGLTMVDAHNAHYMLTRAAWGGIMETCHRRCREEAYSRSTHLHPPQLRLSRHMTTPLVSQLS